MNRPLLVAALLAIALTACSKKEEATTTSLPAPAVTPALPNATDAAPTAPVAAPTATPAPVATPAPEQPPAESKPAN